MTIEQHLSRMIGDLVLTIAKLSADNDALAERLKAAEAETPAAASPSVPGAP